VQRSVPSSHTQALRPICDCGEAAVLRTMTTQTHNKTNRTAFENHTNPITNEQNQYRKRPITKKRK